MTLEDAEYQRWLTHVPRRSQASYGLLGVPVASSELVIDVAYRRLAMDCHPNRIPYTDSDDARLAKLARFRALGDAITRLTDPAYRPVEEIPVSMSPADAMWAWASAVVRAFKRRCPGDSAIDRILASLGVPALMIAMGGAERGGRLCMTFAVALDADRFDVDLCRSLLLGDEDLRIFMHAVMLLDTV